MNTNEKAQEQSTNLTDLKLVMNEVLEDPKGLIEYLGDIAWELHNLNRWEDIAGASAEDYHTACNIYDKIKHSDVSKEFILTQAERIHRSVVRLYNNNPYPYNTGTITIFQNYLFRLPELKALPWSPMVNGDCPDGYVPMPNDIDKYARLFEVLLKR